MGASSSSRQQSGLDGLGEPPQSEDESSEEEGTGTVELYIGDMTYMVDESGTVYSTRPGGRHEESAQRMESMSRDAEGDQREGEPSIVPRLQEEEGEGARARWTDSETDSEDDGESRHSAVRLLTRLFGVPSS